MKKRSWFYGQRRIHAVIWPVDNPVGIIQIVHGMIEYAERYEEFARFANKAGFIVVGNDHAGHGKSVKTKDDYGKFPDEWEEILEDVHNLKIQIQAQYPNLPYVMLGHSMGSYIVRLCAAIFPDKPDAIILTGTGQQAQALTDAGIALAEFYRITKGPDYRSQLLETLTTGAFNNHFKPNRTNSDWLNRDEAEVDKYISDPNHQFRPTVNMYRGIYFFTKLATKSKWMDQIPHNLPILIASGSQDPVGDFGKGVTKFYAYLEDHGFTNVTIRLFNGDRHEILHELNKEEVMQYLIDWINKVI